eukprot:SAG31_NODE_32083_length_360_cov_0.858238_1_plen_37_part_10
MPAPRITTWPYAIPHNARAVPLDYNDTVNYYLRLPSA